jgi:20S proteasome alpha/beta subunit
MSLIVTIPTADGAVIATDSLLVVGQVREQRSKIQRLNSRIAWSGIGELAVVQRVATSLAAFQENNQSLRELAPVIGNIVKSTVKDLLNVDFRTEIYINNLNAISQLHRGDFIFVEWGPTPQILHVNIFGSPVWIQEKPFFIGSGDLFIGHNFQKYKDLNLNLASASIIAYRLVEEAIDSQMFGLGGPADLWQVTSGGPQQIAAQEIKNLQETVKAIKGHEVAVFEKHLAVSLSH